MVTKIQGETNHIVADCLARALGMVECPTARYCPEVPTLKQEAFLATPQKEVLFGGAAGGGKSSALLMSALMYMDIPGYSALICRRDMSRLDMPGSSMNRAKEWLQKWPEVKFNTNKKCFTFPSGAVLQFGYIDRPDDRLRYQSTEFQFIGFDELTELNLPYNENNPYTFLFSRLRKKVGMPVPLRVRSATNPGGPGHSYVLERFISKEAVDDLLSGERKGVYFNEHGRVFMPSLIEDNPFIDKTQYLESLAQLPPITRERLLKGDWTVTEKGQIDPSWLRKYRDDGQTTTLYSIPGKPALDYDNRDMMRFATVDPAGTSAEKAREARGKNSSWSVIGIWDQTPDGRLILRHVDRSRLGFLDLAARLRSTYAQWRPSIMLVENEKYGQAVTELLETDLPIKTIATGSKDKLTRAAPMLTKMERGEFFVPKNNDSWYPMYEKELLAWTGSSDEVCDQIDMSAYAGIHSERTPRTQWGTERISESQFWLEEPNNFKHGVAVGVACPDPDNDNMKMTSIVSVGLDQYGYFWVKCENTREGGAEILRRQDTLLNQMRETPFAIIYHASWYEHSRRYEPASRAITGFRSRGKNELWQRIRPIEDLMRERKIRFLATPGTSSLLGKISTYPMCDDIAPLEAFSNALWAFQAKMGT